MRKYRDGIYQTEVGNTSFVVLFLLPFFLFLTSLAIDFSSWNALRTETEIEAENLAIALAGFLPETELIEKFIAQKVDSTKYLCNFEVGADKESVKVSLKTKFNSSIVGLLSIEAKNELFNVSKEATAQVVPSDTALVLNIGPSLRPQIDIASSGKVELEQAWGNQVDWPAANYFSCAQPQKIANYLNWAWWDMWDETNFRRFSTQGCFNPILSSYKLGVIGLVDSISTQGNSRLAVIFTPGVTEPISGVTQAFQVVRDINGSSDDAELYPNNLGGFLSDSQRSRWLGDKDLIGMFGDETCAIFSSSEVNLNSDYQIPANYYQSYYQAQKNTELLKNPCGDFHRQSGNLDLSAQISLREVIYWKAAKLGKERTPQLVPALTKALEELLYQASEKVKELEKRKRGNIAAKPLRRIVLISDTLAGLDQAEFNNLLEIIHSYGIELDILAFYHSGLSLENKNELSRIPGMLKFNKGLKLFLAARVEELQMETIPKLLETGRKVVLKS